MCAKTIGNSVILFPLGDMSTCMSGVSGGWSSEDGVGEMAKCQEQGHRKPRNTHSYSSSCWERLPALFPVPEVPDAQALLQSTNWSYTLTFLLFGKTGIWTPALCLVGQALYCLSHSSSPSVTQTLAWEAVSEVKNTKNDFRCEDKVSKPSVCCQKHCNLPDYSLVSFCSAIFLLLEIGRDNTSKVYPQLRTHPTPTRSSLLPQNFFYFSPGFLVTWVALTYKYTHLVQLFSKSTSAAKETQEPHQEHYRHSASCVPVTGRSKRSLASNEEGARPAATVLRGTQEAWLCQAGGNIHRGSKLCGVRKEFWRLTSPENRLHSAVNVTNATKLDT